MQYQKAFWVTLILFVLLSVLFVWMCIEHFKMERKSKTNAVGLRFLLDRYLSKSFQKTCLLLLWENSKHKKDIKMTNDHLSSQQQKFVHLYIDSLIKKLESFARGEWITKEILSSLRNHYLHFDMFLFPDVLISDDYYKNLLQLASEKTLDVPLKLTNQEAKTRLDQLLSGVESSKKRSVS